MTTSSKGGAEPAIAAGGAGLPVLCPKPGPPISIGQVGSWSGLVGASIGQARPALALWAKYMNDHGGVACHPVQLRSLDDQSNPSSAAAAARTLIQDDKAIALVAVFSPISVSGIESVTKSTGVPVVGGDGAAHAWTSDPYLYDVGSAIETQFYLASKHEAQEGRKKVAIFYCVEASACSNAGESLSGNSPLSATAAGQQVVYKATMSLTQTDFTAQCEGAKNAGADSLFLGMEGSSITRFLQSCDSIDYHPGIYTVGIAAVFDVNNPTIKKFKISIGAPVFPYMQQDNPVEVAFAGAFGKYAPGFKYNAVAAQAWAEGMLFQRALEMLGPAAQSQQITTAMLLKGLQHDQERAVGRLDPPTDRHPGGSRQRAQSVWRRPGLHGGRLGVRGQERVRLRSEDRRQGVRSGDGGRGRSGRRFASRVPGGACRPPADRDRALKGSPMAIDFTGQVAIVTGAGRGLGRSHAELLAGRGAKVVANDVAGAAEVADAINRAGGQAVASDDDISTPAGAASLVHRAADEFGGVQILINNAGVGRFTTLGNASIDEYEAVRRSGLDGTFYVTREVWPHMTAAKYRRIVVTTSGNGLLGNPSSVTYAIAKAGVYGMMRAVGPRRGGVRDQGQRAGPDGVDADVE